MKKMIKWHNERMHSQENKDTITFPWLIQVQISENVK